ncbi:MAG: UxaA family hydrolase [Terriglobales bacterium]
MQQKVLQLDPRDNVLIALVDLKPGEEVNFSGKRYTLVSTVPAKHKFATEDLQVGARVIMYGVVVGSATKPIAQGSLLNTGNVHHQAATFHAKSEDFHWKAPDVSRWKGRTFLGFPRSDGQVGTRNYWLVVPLVFCENRNIGVLKQAFEEELGFAAPQVYRRQIAELVQLYREGKTESFAAPGAPDDSSDHSPQRVFENIDGIKFLVHEGGCGGTREDSTNLCGLIAGYINHPNVAGATILSLGCQHAQAGILRQQIRLRNPNFDKPLFIVEQQQSGTEFAMLSEAIRQTFAGLAETNKATRVGSALSHLTVGLKCGGSDGFSGISANPAIGHTSDLIVALGGKTILSEFPELCGVEQQFINRSTRKEVSDRFIQLMQSYNARAQAVGSGFDMNPSPGNIRDGLITDAMKSAGAAKKGGTSAVAAVIDYPEYATEAGLNLQCTPGNDVECVTAQVGAGANIVLFTTGLGTPTGNPIAPVVKLSTNSNLAQRMSDIIDIDTGRIVSGETTIERVGEEILELVIKVAS